MIGIKINKTLRNVLIALAVIILIFAIPSFFPEKNYHAKYDNYDLQIALKWIFNALFLAEQYNIKPKNLSFFATNDIPELRNLLGDSPQMWQGLGLQPAWVREIIGTLGNYSDIYERNIGSESPYKLPRDKEKLMRDGGTVLPLSFI